MNSSVRTSEQPKAVAAEPQAPASGGLSERALVLVVAVVALPILWMGYGTDVDVAHVLEAAEGIRDGHYEPSRTPGVPVYEAVAAVLDPLGGHLALNLATAVAGAFAVVGLARLVRAWGHANGDLVGLAFFASPVTVIASTSVADFMPALAFFVWGALAHLRDRRVLAGVLFGLAIGCRLSTGFFLAAFLVADGWDRSHRRRCLTTAAVTLPVAAALYLPSWIAFDHSFRFLEHADGYAGFANNLGRFLYKNYANAGIALVVLLVVALPALVAVLRRWGQDPMLRFAVLGFVVTEVLFFQLPWKGAHLLPSLLALLLWLAASSRNTRGFLWLVVGALALNAVVAFRPLAAANPDDAGGARWDPGLTAGLLVNDIRCRLDLMDRYPTQQVSEEAWDCSLKPMRGPSPEGLSGVNDRN